MNLHLEDWQTISLLITFLGLILGYGKMVLSLISRMLDERFAAQDKAREETRTHWDAKFQGLENAARQDTAQWQDVQRELLQLKAELPLQYVRRDDYIRNQSVIEAKLDAVAAKIENMTLRANHGT